MRLWVIMLAVVVAISSLGCAVVQIVRTAPGTPSAPLPQPPVVEAGVTPEPTALPTATATETPLPTETPTHTPEPTPTPQPATPTSTPTNTPAPTRRAAPPPTDTPEPPPTDTPVSFTTLHGVIGSLELVDPQPEYKNGANVFVRWKVQNPTDFDVSFGILGIAQDNGSGRPEFQSSRSGPNNYVPAGGEIGAEDRIRLLRYGTQIRGQIHIYVSMCFSKYEECEQPGADWELVSPPLTVNIVP